MTLSSIVMEFDSQKDLEEAYDHLWRKLGVTGEANIKPLGGGGWRLEIISEKSLRPNTMDKLKGRLVE